MISASPILSHRASVLRWGWLILVVIPFLPNGAAARTAADGLGLRRSQDNTADRSGLFEGKDYAISLRASTGFGFESNYQVDTRSTIASPIWALEASIEFELHKGEHLSLSTELYAVVRVPTEDMGLTEVAAELPFVLRYALSSRLAIRLASVTFFERAKSPPVHHEIVTPTSDDAGTSTEYLSSGAIRFLAISSIFKPSLEIRLGTDAQLIVGPYFRIKQVNFLRNLTGGEPDYRLYDAGGTGSLYMPFRSWLGLRLRYDFAARYFENYLARLPSATPVPTDYLRMTRHLLGALMRFSVASALSLQVSYDARLVIDNGGYYSYVDSIAGLAGSYSWNDKLYIHALGQFIYRRYLDRTPCAALDDGTGSDCSTAEAERQVQNEYAFEVEAGASYAILDWFEINVRYEFELAQSRIEILSVPNHRLLGGVGFQY